MTFTYSSTDLSSTLAKIRLRLGDTESAEPLLTDEEIQYFIDDTEDLKDATLKACRAIVAKLAKRVDINASGLSSTKTSKFRQYKELLAEIEKDTSMAAQMFVGGVSKDRQESADADTDFRPHSFGIGMHDYNSNADPLDKDS